jgi:hypothetical protein
MEYKKKVKVIEYSKHPEMEGDELKVAIMNSEKIKPRLRSKLKPRKLKQPKMTIMQLAGIVNQLAGTVNNLAIQMRAGFAAINKEIVDIKETLKRHEKILKKHELIFERNNLK